MNLFKHILSVGDFWKNRMNDEVKWFKLLHKTTYYESIIGEDDTMNHEFSGVIKNQIVMQYLMANPAIKETGVEILNLETVMFQKLINVMKYLSDCETEQTVQVKTISQSMYKNF